MRKLKEYSKESITKIAMELLEKSDKYIGSEKFYELTGISMATQKKYELDISAMSLEKGFKPYKQYSKQELENRISEYLLTTGVCYGITDLSKNMGIDFKTFKDYGINPISLAKSLKVPVARIRGPGDHETLKGRLVEVINRENRYITYTESIKLLKTSYTRLKNRGITRELVVEINNSLGFTRLSNEGATMGEINNFKHSLVASIHTIIEKSEKVLSVDEMCITLGIGRHRLHRLGIYLYEIYESLGIKPPYSFFENKVYEHLITIFSIETVERQKTFEGLKSKNKLRYDFYIPSINLLVEADGPQHYDTNHWHYSDGTTQRDELKNRYALENGINLVRIRYEPRLSLDHVKNALSGIPLKLSVGQPAAKPDYGDQEGSTTIPEGSRTEDSPKYEASSNGR